MGDVFAHYLIQVPGYPSPISLPTEGEYLAHIHGRYQCAGRVHKQRILDEFCATFGYHRKSALRLLIGLWYCPNRGSARPHLYDPVQLLPSTLQ